MRQYAYPEFLDDRRHTVQEYLDLEAGSDIKHDYLNGRILNMAGGPAAHNSIAVNIAGEFRQSLKGSGCRVFNSDQRLQDHGRTLYTYPDVQVVCGESVFAERDVRGTTLTNPKVIVEVLSPSTEAYDQVDKFRRYLALPSLTAYLIVSQSEARVVQYHRNGDGTWTVSWVEGLDMTLSVPSLGVAVPMAEIYRDVTFPAVTPYGGPDATPESNGSVET